jgi:hypothetical protein
VPNRRFFYSKAINTQTIDFIPKVLDLNRWELLAAVQALAVYLIVRVSEGETEYNNFDSLLQNTVAVKTSLFLCLVIVTHEKQVVCAQFNLHEKNSQPAWSGEAKDMGWKQWIFNESKRRCVRIVP